MPSPIADSVRAASGGRVGANACGTTDSVRSGHIGDLINGVTPGGRPFWAFWHSLSDNVPHGFASRVRRSVASSTRPGRCRPSRWRTGTARAGAGANPAQGILANLQQSTGRKLQKRPGVDAGRPGRTFDWAVGSEEFQGRYRVRAEEGSAAEWLAGPAIQLALLSRRPAISLTSNGEDILARTDYGWTGPDGVTDYGEQIGNVQDLDIVTIAARLELLDMVPLSPKPGRAGDGRHRMIPGALARQACRASLPNTRGPLTKGRMMADRPVGLVLG